MFGYLVLAISSIPPNWKKKKSSKRITIVLWHQLIHKSICVEKYPWFTPTKLWYNIIMMTFYLNQLQLYSRLLRTCMKAFIKSSFMLNKITVYAWLVVDFGKEARLFNDWRRCLNQDISPSRKRISTKWNQNVNES